MSARAAPAAATDTSDAGRMGRGLSLALVAPLLILLALAFLWPLGKLFWGSVFTPQATAEHYLRIVEEPLYIRIFVRTAMTAAVVTVLALLLGYPVAVVMARQRGRVAMLIAACVLIPLWTSILVRSYAWIVLLQRTGVINTLLQQAGITDRPLQLLYSEGAVIVAMTHVLLPYVILPVYASLAAIPPELERAARNLGAGTWQSFRTVTWPLSLPGVYSGAVMVFILSLGFYVTPALVGGPRNLTISTLIAQQTTELLNWPFAGALAAALLVATLALVGVFGRFLQFQKT